MSTIIYTRPELDINGRPYHPYLSPFCPTFKHSGDFSPPPEGYFLLPEKGVDLKDWRMGCRFFGLSGLGWVGTHISFDNSDPVLEYKKHSRSVPNAASINNHTIRLYDAMLQYKEKGTVPLGFPTLESAGAEPVTGQESINSNTSTSPTVSAQPDCAAEVAELKRQIEELKKKVDGANGENSTAGVKNPAPHDFAAGDWVVCIDTENSGLEPNGLYKVYGFIARMGPNLILEGFPGSYWAKRFRRATQEEIDKRLTKFKKGDWVICIDPVEALTDLGLYKVEYVNGDGDLVYLESIPCGYMSVRFRRATQEEINKHLAPKFKKGDWVVWKSTDRIGHFFTDSLTVGKLYQLTKGEHKNPGKYRGDEGRTFVRLVNDDNDDWTYLVDRFRHATPEEIDAHLNKVVVIRGGDGRDYTAEYHKGYVKFGCAKIENNMIRNLCFYSNNEGGGNRTITSVTIGAGVFKPEDLNKLVKNLID